MLRDFWSLEERAGREPVQNKEPGVKGLPGAESVLLYRSEGVLVCSRASSCRGLFRSEDQEERCLISLHLEKRAGKEPRREEELTKKESTFGTVQVLKVDSSVPRYL